MKEADQTHDWICIGVQQGGNMQLIEEFRQIALLKNHKFGVFYENEVKFAIMGIKSAECHPDESQSPNYESPRSGAVRSAASPPTIKLKVVD